MPTLEWIGKDKVINHHQNVPYRVLEEKYTYNAEHSDNMIIRGDNLEALKALLPKYEGRIKCIYIDPPYNTAKSTNENQKWKYNDNVDSPKIRKWLNVTVGNEEEDFTRHDKWLCMMYPRLRLLHKLLDEDGIIFISIDDNEQANLRFICDEIFGRKNFLAQLIWKSDGNFDNQAKIKVCHEYVLCYQKNIDFLGLPNGINPEAGDNSKIHNDFIENTVVKNGYKNPMSKITLPVGFPCSVETLDIPARTDKYPLYLNDAKIRNGKLTNDTVVKSGWASKNILLSYIQNGFKPIIDTKGQETIFEITSTGNIYLKKKRAQQSLVMSIVAGLGSTQSMSTLLQKMSIDFDFPKPITFVEYLLNFYSTSNSLILDSFAGSGTTAHAVLNMNKADNGNRKFILIEMEDYAESITAERVKRVIDGYGEGKNAVDGTGGDFTFYDLGEPLLIENNQLNDKVDTQKIREYVWFMETKQPLYEADTDDNEFFLGVNNDNAYYFYYEKDKITTLNNEFLATIETKADTYIIYADKCTYSDESLMKYNITFKKIPRDISKL